MFESSLLSAKCISFPSNEQNCVNKELVTSPGAVSVTAEKGQRGPTCQQCWFPKDVCGIQEKAVKLSS